MSKKVKEKRTDWKSLWNDFLSAGKIEISQEEEILKSAESDEVKKALLETLNSREKIATKMFKNQYRALQYDKSTKKEQVNKAVKEYLDKNNKTVNKESQGRELVD